MSLRPLMTPTPATLRAEEPLSRAAELMRNGRFGLLPVVDPEGRPVGLVTPRDICMATLDRHLAPQDLTVADAMCTNVTTVDVDATAGEAEDRMARAGVRRLPVVDAQHKLVGVISLGDIARAVAYAGFDNGHGARRIDLTLARVRRTREAG